MRPVSFSIDTKLSSSLGRAGVLHTPHGILQTPAFISVATKATIKGIQSSKFEELGIQALIANTYHLYLSGQEAVSRAGGVGAFMNFAGPTMTDSGGFQVFSLGVGFGKKLSKFLPEEVSAQDGILLFNEEIATSHGKLAIVDEEGVSFTSHLDGSLHRFTPERSIEIQHVLGADIVFSFDECTAPTASYEYQKEAMERTHNWARRSLFAHRGSLQHNESQGIFGILQGGRHEDLRFQSANTLGEMDFDGYGIGGSFSKRDLIGLLDVVDSTLPESKPRHLLGIGEPEDLFIGVASGIDTFDCVLPTRNGRTGGAYTRQGKIQIPNAEFTYDEEPLDLSCHCPVCLSHSRSYINHLFRVHELLGPVLTSMHNLYFITHLLFDIRKSILDGQFEMFRDDFLSMYKVR